MTCSLTAMTVQLAEVEEESWVRWAAEYTASRRSLGGGPVFIHALLRKSPR